MKKILIVSFSDLSTDPRVNRQIRFLKDAYKLITIGLASSNIDGVDFIPIIPPPTHIINRTISAIKLITGQYESYYWNKPEMSDLFQTIMNLEFDLIIVNDIDPLPVAVKVAQKKSIKIIFDAHEYAPKEWEESLKFKIFWQQLKFYLCNTYIPQVDSMITVCQTIADTYEKDTAIKPIIITNAPDYEELTPTFLQKNQKIKLIHHGNSSASRKIHKMIKMMTYLDDRFELNFLLVGGKLKYNKYLRDLARGNQNIKFLTSVPMRELSRFLNQFDIGVYILEPSNFNSLYALPNKFFEFVQARLAIAIGPSPEMAHIIQEHDLGIISDDFEPKSLAQKLMTLDYKRINYYKHNSHQIARAFSAENNKQILLRLIHQIFLY